tara:strand:- start:26687 stop:26884 length:198 start_codon:yes stop_codon:yes gene_type:complete
MRVKGLVDKLRVLNVNNVPCTSKEFDQLREGIELALPREIAERMSAMGLVKITDNNKTNKKAKEK